MNRSPRLQFFVFFPGIKTLHDLPLTTLGAVILVVRFSVHLKQLESNAAHDLAGRHRCFSVPANTRTEMEN